jgi:hypothetical protein
VGAEEEEAGEEVEETGGGGATEAEARDGLNSLITTGMSCERHGSDGKRCRGRTYLGG